MKRRHILLISILTLSTLILLGCTDPTSPDSSEPSGLSAEESGFVELVNEHRESQGLNRLSWFSSLADVAQAHSEDMRDRNFFSHTNPDGDDPFDRMAAAGITYQAAAENIASGYTTGQSVLDGWLNSSGHRANIENATYTHHGIGYVEDGNYWTHVFARNPSVQ